MTTVNLASAISLPLPAHRRRIYLRNGKRVFDLVFAFVLLPFLIPVIVMLWLAVKLDGGPGFFGHERLGRDGRRFKCWKLRSMVPNAQTVLKQYLAENPEAAAEWETSFKLRNDPRITRVGRFLRRTSLDELPQIWNVLKGEMSFVGPRPIVADEVRKYGDQYSTCFSIRPGITGIWQIRGRNATTYKARVQYDFHYVQNASLRLDLAIILRTAASVLRMTGQ
ncbi:MAG: sugar transferase [Rhodobacteraceae bacterium]|nr:sugar transferase [Paracoccaceae bacterium]